MKLKFKFQEFDLIVKSKLDNPNITNKKSLEYLFCDEKNYNKVFKNTGGNFGNKENIKKAKIILEEEKEILKLENGYFEYDKNIFYDYLDLDFELTNGYKLEIIDNYNDNNFLIEKESNKEVNKYNLVYKSNSEDKVYGFWGFVKFRIYKNDKSYIFSPFFKTRNLEEEKSVEKMLNDIKEELYYSLYTYKNISTSGYKIKNKKDLKENNWSFIKIFELFYKDLEKSINNILESAKYKNNINYERKIYNGGNIKIDNRFIRDSLKKGYYDTKTKNLNIYGKTIINKTINSDYNNISNKIFLDLTQMLVKKLEYFLSIGENKINLTFLDTIKENKNIIKGKRKAFINKYNIDINKLSNYSIDYQYLDSKYKKFVLNYLRLFSILELFNGELFLANKSIDQIYEYWTLLKVRDIIHHEITPNKKKERFKIKVKKQEILFELGNNEKVQIKSQNKNVNIIYKFQQNIKTVGITYIKPKNLRDTQIPNLRTLSAKSIPDIFIEINDKDTGKFKYLIFDAKYSTNGTIKNRFENLYKYKSGILNCGNLKWENNDWNGDLEPLKDLEVVALYPGINKTEIENIIKEEKSECEESCEIKGGNTKLIKLYEKSVNDIGFGAYIMNPKEEKFEKVEELIKRKIN